MVEHMFAHSGRAGRVEVHTGVGRRRRWTADQKATVVAESFAPGAVASDVARRHEISPQHLFQWRKAARSGRLVLPSSDEMSFATVMLEPTVSPGAGSGLEVEIGGAVIRVRPDSDLRLVAALVHLLRQPR